MKKEGTLAFDFLGQLLVGAFILISITSAGYQFGKGEALTKITTAKEIGLLINTLCGIDGDVAIAIDWDVSEYTIAIEENMVYVHDANFNRDTAPVLGVYAIRDGCVSDHHVKKPTSLTITKMNNKISLQDQHG